MSDLHGKVRIGTCSWKYPEWHGLAASAPKGIDYLAEYSLKYSTVEIDQWFWSLFSPSRSKAGPIPADVLRYREAVPEDFRFSIKVPNSITLTHYYQKGKSGILGSQSLFPLTRSFPEIPGVDRAFEGISGTHHFPV